MSKAAKITDGEPEAKRGPALWKQQLGEISDRNAEARKRGQARVKVLAMTRAGNRRVTAGHEADQLRKLNAKLDKARSRR